MSSNSEWIGPSEAARVAGVTRAALERWIADGRLPSVRIAGRRVMRRADVLVWRLAREERLAAAAAIRAEKAAKKERP